MTRQRRAGDMVALIEAVADLVGDDGTGGLGEIVALALADDPRVTCAEIAEIVREARRDAAVEAGRERG